MTVQTAAHAAAERLLHDKEAIARAVTAKLYYELPDILEKHGERGLMKCLQDMHYNIEHLIPAVDLEQPEMFASYVTWLNNMLGSRGVPTRDVRRCLELLSSDVQARYAPAEASAVTRVIDAGLARLAV